MTGANWAAVLDHPEVVRIVAARARRRAAGRLTREDSLQEARVWVARRAARWRHEIGPLWVYLQRSSPRPRRREPYSRPGVVMIPWDEPAPIADPADRARSDVMGVQTVGDLFPDLAAMPEDMLDAATCVRHLSSDRSKGVLVMWAWGWRLREIAPRWGISRERTRQIEAEAIQLIRYRIKVDR